MRHAVMRQWACLITEHVSLGMDKLGVRSSGVGNHRAYCRNIVRTVPSFATRACMVVFEVHIRSQKVVRMESFRWLKFGIRQLVLGQ